jgi:hypothetical protein
MRNRFDDAGLYKQSLAPGPGSYNIDKDKPPRIIGTLLNINNNKND